MLPRLLYFFIWAVLYFHTAASSHGDDELLPFGDKFLPTLTFSEAYTDVVTLGDFGYEQVATSSLVVKGKFSMAGVDLAEMFAEDAAFSFTAGDMEMELGFAEAEVSVVNGRTVLTWEVEGVDYSTGDIFEAGAITISYTQVDLILNINLQNVSNEYSIYAVSLAGSEDELDDFPLITAIAFGPYGFSDTTLYVSGSSTVSEKTVAAGTDDEQTFDSLGRVRLSGEIDATNPTVTVVYPPPRTKMTERPITASGKYSDKHGVFSVELSLNGGPFILADLADGIWSVPFLDLEVGKNRMIVRCTDMDGHVKETARDTTFTLMSPLRVTAAGDAPGRVTSSKFSAISYTPDAPAPISVSSQKDGSRVVVSAVPGAGAVFDGWTSNKPLTDAQKASRRLSFVHQPNMELTAHFMVNPFTPVKGTYYGLVSGADSSSTGFFSLRLANNGSFTGSLRVGSVHIPLKGRFSNTGHFNGQVRVKGVTYTVNLALNVAGTGPSRVTGSASGGDLNVAIGSDLGVFNSRTNPAPTAGTYNVLLPPVTGQPDPYPIGTGYGRVTVNKNGLARFSGRLATGPAFNAAAQLSAANEWPFYGALYGRRGSIAGTVSFDLSNPAHDLSGSLTWFQPADAKGAAAHPEGFNGQSTLVGAKFVVPQNGQRLFLEADGGFGALAIEAEADDTLPELRLTLDAELSTANALTVTLPAEGDIQKLTLKLNRATGLFTGSLTEGATARALRGAVVGPKLNRAGGYFIRGTRTGSISITLAR